MKIQIKFLVPVLSLILALSQFGCDPRSGGGQDDSHDHDHDHEHDHSESGQQSDLRVRVAVADLQPTEGNEVSGTVTFTQVEEGIRVVAEISGLEGNGPRGFHIHEKGDCSAPDATSAGGHFNPTDMPHGSPQDDLRHTGDFGNLEVDEEGNARAEFIDTRISFDGMTSILDRAVIVHAEEDDLESQPTGDAGARAACGVIQAQEYFE